MEGDELEFMSSKVTPQIVYPSAWQDPELDDGTRCGGPNPREDAGHQLVTPKLLGAAPDAFFSQASVKKRGTLEQLDEVAQEAVMSKLADSTRRSHGTGWKQWCLFLAGIAQSPHLQGESQTEKLSGCVLWSSCISRWAAQLRASVSGFLLSAMLTWPQGTLTLFKGEFDFGQRCRVA